MILRPFDLCVDFDRLQSWSTDRRIHAMWCSDLFRFPFARENFAAVLEELGGRTGDRPYVAAEEDGTLLGFFCFSVQRESREGMFKFVMVNPACRGRGIGEAMLGTVLERVFAETDLQAVHLNVFLCNERAKKCYEKLGFAVRGTRPRAFVFRGEGWDLQNMVICRPQPLPNKANGAPTGKETVL